MPTLEEIRALMGEICPGANLESTGLVDDEEIDSFDIVTIVGELCANYNVELDVDDLVPENFNSCEAILALVKSKL